LHQKELYTLLTSKEASDGRAVREPFSGDGRRHCWDQGTLFPEPQTVWGGHQVVFAVVPPHLRLPEHPFAPKHQAAGPRARALAWVRLPAPSPWADLRALRTLSLAPAL